MRSTYETLAAYLAAGVLHTPVHRVFPLEEALEAIAEASQEKRTGKVLLRMQGIFLTELTKFPEAE